MTLPKLNLSLEMPYFDNYTYQFQLTEDGTGVNITDQTLIMYIKKKDDATFTPIENDIDAQGWFVTPGSGIFNIVIDTETYLMQVGHYQLEVEWEDEKTSLVFIEINVFTDIRHQP